MEDFQKEGSHDDDGVRKLLCLLRGVPLFVLEDALCHDLNLTIVKVKHAQSIAGQCVPDALIERRLSCDSSSAAGEKCVDGQGRKRH